MDNPFSPETIGSKIYSGGDIKNDWYLGEAMMLVTEDCVILSHTLAENLGLIYPTPEEGEEKVKSRIGFFHLENGLFIANLTGVTEYPNSMLYVGSNIMSKKDRKKIMTGRNKKELKNTFLREGGRYGIGLYTIADAEIPIEVVYPVLKLEFVSLEEFPERGITIEQEEEKAPVITDGFIHVEPEVVNTDGPAVQVNQESTTSTKDEAALNESPDPVW